MPSRIVTALPFTEYVTATGNYDESRSPIDTIVIHTTACTLKQAIDRFGAYGTYVSAHYIIDLDGKIYHGLEETFTAYHAGNYLINQRSIGIEHSDNGDYNGQRTDQLYQTSGQLIADICKFYSIPLDRDHIKLHKEVSDHPTNCPDALDIDRIMREANGVLNPSIPPTVPPVPPVPPDPCADIKAELKTEQDTNNQLLLQVQDLQNQLVACRNWVGFMPKSYLGKLFYGWAKQAG